MFKFAERARFRRSISVVSDLIEIGQFVGGLVTFLVAAAIAAKYAGIYLVPILSALAAIGVTLGILWSRRAIRRVKRARQTDWNPWIWVKERHSDISIESPQRASYTSKLHLVILQHDVSRIHLRSGWTGKGEVEVSVRNKGFKYQFDRLRLEENRVLIIGFDRPYGKNDELVLEYTVTTTADPGSEPQPYYSLVWLDTRVPQKASIRISFANPDRIVNVQTELYASDSALWPLKPPQPLEPDRYGAVTWEPPCQRGHRCCIRWEYE